jgi:hypothetical protein
MFFLWEKALDGSLEWCVALDEQLDESLQKF